MWKNVKCSQYLDCLFFYVTAEALICIWNRKAVRQAVAIF